MVQLLTPVLRLNPYLEPVPNGVGGELYIGGLGVAREYLNRPELTGKSFVTVNIDGQLRRLYRTGDQVGPLGR